MSFKNKKILITAGPTWAAIDSVRVISNTATCETGLLLSKALSSRGAKITLLAGNGCEKTKIKNLKVISFRFFDQFQDEIKREIGPGKYDIVIHSAAVSDYKLKKSYPVKLKSGIKNLKLLLVPAPRIIDSIKKLDPALFLVGFKFEPNASRERLFSGAKKLLLRAGADLVVANTVINHKYRAYVLDEEKASPWLSGKKELVKYLVNKIGEKLCR